ncbi:MAG TPA: tail fiber domain-containing protein, partial [Candidatus Fimivivens sp.]|nr:tail fiber domain-containing protein [Candidatus Fimivivens sp.]
ATDEATVSYTSGNILSFATDSTTNGDIAFFTDDLYLDKSTGNVGVGTASPSYALDVNGAVRTGYPGTDGQLRIYSEQGTTDYQVIFNPAAAMTQNTTYTLPVDDGASGQQLQTDGAGVLTWAAASSTRETKVNIVPFGSPSAALDQLLSSNVYRFNYKPGMGTGDSETTYVGVMADESSWAMHFGGTIINPVNTLGYMVLGIQATNEKIDTLNLKTDGSVASLSGLQASVDDNLLMISGKFDELDTNDASFGERLAEIDGEEGRLTTLDGRVFSLEQAVGTTASLLTHETRIAQIESEMTTLRDEHLALLDFFTTFKLGDVLMKDAEGDVDLLGGSLTLGTLVADKLCLEDVCVTKTQLQGMLDATGQDSVSQASTDPAADGEVAGVTVDSSASASDPDTSFKAWAANIDEAWTKDYLMVLDEHAYSSGAGSVSGYAVSYALDLSGATPKAKLTVTFDPTNGPAGIDTLTTIRIFVPEGGWLTAMSGNDGNPEFPPIFRGKKSFAIPVRISPSTGHKVMVEYTLPVSVTADPYDLKLQMQTGTGAVPVTFSITEADGTKTEKNITLDADAPFYTLP